MEVYFSHFLALSAFLISGRFFFILYREFPNLKQKTRVSSSRHPKKNKGGIAIPELGILPIGIFQRFRLNFFRPPLGCTVGPFRYFHTEPATTNKRLIEMRIDDFILINHVYVVLACLHMGVFIWAGEYLELRSCIIGDGCSALGPP